MFWFHGLEIEIQCDQRPIATIAFAQRIFNYRPDAIKEVVLQCGFVSVNRSSRTVLFSGRYPSREYSTPARRPLNSRLDCLKIRDAFGILMPEWEEGLASVLQSKGATQISVRR
jgi:hypothetical protein